MSAFIPTTLEITNAEDISVAGNATDIAGMQSG